MKKSVKKVLAAVLALALIALGFSACGGKDVDLPWEHTDKIDALKAQF